MTAAIPKALVHLELHTGHRAGAGEFYRALCGWEPEEIRAGGGSYTAIALGNGVDGGIVECATTRPLWLPYVEVDDIAAATEQARRLGAQIVLEPREGPTGWRSVVASPVGGEVALWQPKR